MSAPEARLARALLKAAAAQGQIERVLEELKAVQEPLLTHGAFFRNPTVPSARQEPILRDVLAGQVSALTLEFLCLLVRRRKMKALPAIVRRYADLAARETAAMEVLLRIPYAPPPAMLDSLRGYFVRRGLVPAAQQERIPVRVVIDKRLIAGFVAECGSLVLDHSLRSRMDGLLPAGR